MNYEGGGGGRQWGGERLHPFPLSAVHHFARFVTDFFVVVVFLAVSTHFLPFYPTKEPDPKLIKTGSRSGEQARAPNQLGGL